MSPKKVWLVAVDVLREALFSRYLVVLFGIITLGLVALGFSLDLEVVDGAIATGKLFGGSINNLTDGRPMLAKEVLGPLITGMAYVTFYLGMIFLVVAVADIAPKMFAPGRVELMLSLPVRRVEIVLGTYVGVLIIALLALCLAVGGGSAVLFVKTEVFTVAPLAGALSSLVGFMTLYAVMLAVATVARSAALSAGAAFMLFVAGVATSDRGFVVSLIRSGTTRKLVSLLIGPLPRLRVLGDFGADVAMKEPLRFAELVPAVGGCLALAGFCVVVACAIVQMKDY